MAKKQQQPPARARAVNQVHAAYQKGASIRTIAARTGRSYGTVHNMLAESNTKMRSRGGPNHKGKH